MDTNIVNKKMSQHDDALRNVWVRFEVQFMKKVLNTDAELEKSIAYKKACSQYLLCQNVLYLS